MHLESIMATSTRVLQVACGFDHTAVLVENRSVLTFGNHMDGQLGHQVLPNFDPKNTRFQAPAAMVLPRRAAQVACGNRFTLVLTTRMEVYICGREELTGSNTLDGPPKLPAQNPALQGLPIVYNAAGAQHTVVLTAQGTAYAWGANPAGACGRGFPKLLTVPVPIQVPHSNQKQPGQLNGKLPSAPFSNWAAWEVGSPNTITSADDCSVIDVACGSDFSVLVTKTGNLLVAGSNDQRQLRLENNVKAEVYPVEKVHHPTEGNVFVSVEGLLDGILLEKETAKQESVVQGLADQIEELFRCPAVMNSVFLDPREIDDLYTKTMAAAGDRTYRQRVVNAMERGMMKGLEAIGTARLMYPESI